MKPPPPVWALVAGCVGAVALLPGGGGMARTVVASAALLLLGVALARRKRPWSRVIGCGAFGVLLGVLAWSAWLARTAYYENDPDFAPLRLKAHRVRIVDSRCTRSLGWLPNPALIEAECLAGDGIPAGRVRLNGLPEKAAYGDLFTVTGTLRPDPWRRSGAVLAVDAAGAAEESRGGLQGWLLRGRDWLLGRIAAGLPDDRTRNTVAALLFGCYQGIGDDDVADYVKVGVIHLFSVSGLHIGILGMLVLAALFWCPFRWRYRLALLAVLYVAMTGWQTPAVRAFLMFGAWCVGRSALARTPTLRWVGLAAVAILCWRPGELWSMGFQFSFLVTALLVAAVECQRGWREALEADRLWRPPSTFRQWSVKFALNVRNKLFAMLFCSVVAYAGGCVLVLYYQGLFAPVSVLANFLLIPVITVLYPAAALQSLVTGIPGVEAAASGVTAGLTALMDGVVRFSAECVGGNGLAAPAVWQMMVFYCGLFWLALAGRRALAGWIPVLAMGVWWAAAPAFMEPEILVVRGAYRDRPAVIIAEPALERARAAGVITDYRAAREAAGWLARRGLRRLDAVYLTGNLTDDWRGLAAMAHNIEVGEVVLTVPAGRRNPVREAVAGEVEFGGFRPGDGRRNSDYRLELPEKECFRLILGLHGGELELHLQQDWLAVLRDGVELGRVERVMSSRPEMMELSL